MGTAGVERQRSHVWRFERCGRVRRRVANGCLEVEAVQNSSTTKTRAPKKRAARRQLQTGGRPKLPHVWQAEGRKGGQGFR